MPKHNGKVRVRWAVWVPVEEMYLNRHANLTNKPHHFLKERAKQLCTDFARKEGHHVRCILVPYNLKPPKR